MSQIYLLHLLFCRRAHSSEQLDKAKANNSQDPKGLKFRKSALRSAYDIKFRGDIEESTDGSTTVQENPLKQSGAFNFGFVHNETSETDRDMNEINIGNYCCHSFGC